MASQPSASHSSRRQRASHTVTSSHPADPDLQQPKYRDVYAHPAAQAWAAAHPGRAIPKFGPYLLLQTLGEGEFGKVKLGLHTTWGEEAAVKLIKRHNIDSAVRMSKVEREIEVLRMLKHPNIVRLYDVIETDKYIGIILDYASGGELFDHILAHRYLKEKDACKLFAQLISGVWYIHERKIVHRDLKLENLLLDRNRNVIITDFGFANRFEHRADDLMQTSCGSPCYAAPELVISEGAYVGSAVDIWSCGVILYAMLAGYLPFDDDPANPDGDNINLLYKYIVSTPLAFPDYISPEARDLLGIMLQPDPTRRASLAQVMAHPWLAPFAHLFDKRVEDLEHIAMELHRQKRLQYQKQMRQAAAAAASSQQSQQGGQQGQGQDPARVARSQSARTDVFPHASVSGASPSRARTYAAQPEFLYETSAEVQQQQQQQQQQPPSSSRANANNTVGSQGQGQRQAKSSAAPSVDDDPFASAPIAHAPAPAPAPGQAQRTKKDSAEKKDMRHTIQVEFVKPDENELGGMGMQRGAGNGMPAKERGGSTRPGSAKGSGSGSAFAKEREREREASRPGSAMDSTRTTPTPTKESSTGRRKASNASASRVPVPSFDAPTPVVTVSSAGPPTPDEKATYAAGIGSPPPSAFGERMGAGAGGSPGEKDKTGAGSTYSRSSSTRHRKGLSLDKIGGGIGKIFGGGNGNGNGGDGVQRQASTGADSVQRQVSTGSGKSANGHMSISSPSSRRPSTLQVAPSPSEKSGLLSPVSPGGTINNSEAVIPDGRKSRRSTMSVLAHPLNTLKGRPKTGAASRDVRDGSLYEKPAPGPPSLVTEPEPMQPSTPPRPSMREKAGPGGPGAGAGQGQGQEHSMAASSNKARKVMQWFRSRSKGGDEDASLLESERSSAFRTNASSTSVNLSVAPSVSSPAPTPLRSASEFAAGAGGAGQPSFGERVMRHVAPRSQPAGVLRIHHGAVDSSTITSNLSPAEVMSRVRAVLDALGIDVQEESEFKYRCVRRKRRRPGTAGAGQGPAGLAAVVMVGSAASNGVDRRGLPVPSPPPAPSLVGSTGGMLKGLLMRRQSSQVSATTEEPSGSPQAPGSASDAEGGEMGPPMPYGDAAHDVGDEVRFYVELTRLDRLSDTLSLDIRRLKGNLKSYKFLYDTVRDRVNLQR